MDTTPPLKILIVSTPKTGNTWLNNLLCAIYDLPSVGLPSEFDVAQAQALGQRWVCQQRYLPHQRLLDWASRNNVHLLTTVRHPCDILLSNHHYVINYADAPGMQRNWISTAAYDGHELGANTAALIRSSFWCFLGISLAWHLSGRSTVVRYEDLWRDPVTTLAELTNRIAPVAISRIERAVAQCEIGLMRDLAGSHAKFFRKGQVGGWITQLSPAIVEAFRRDPYPAFFAAFGYSLDPNDPLMTAPPRPRPRGNPFEQTRVFEDGTPVAPVLVKLYLSLDDDLISRWPAPTSTAPDSFYSWLTQPASEDPHPEAKPLISNLAIYLYRQRGNLLQQMPDPFGEHRVDVAEWFARDAQRDYQLAGVFVKPMLESLKEWNNQPSPADVSANDLPIITRLASRVHRSRAEHMSRWTDIYGADRIDYLIWFLARARLEHDLNWESILPMQEAFCAWANQPADGARATTRIMAYLRQRRPDWQQRFPNVPGGDEDSFAQWFLREGQWETLLPHFYDPQDKDYLEWANERAAADYQRPLRDPPITRLMLRIYQSRPDLQAQYPDIYGRDRIAFAAHILAITSGEYALGRHMIAPLLGAWNTADGLAPTLADWLVVGGDQEVTDAVAQTVEARLAQRQPANEQQADRIAEELWQEHIGKSAAEMRLASLLSEGHDIVPRNYTIDWHVPILGPINSLVRRIINLEIKRYLDPAIHKQSRLNQQYRDALLHLAAEQEKLEEEIRRLRSGNQA